MHFKRKPTLRQITKIETIESAPSFGWGALEHFMKTAAFLVKPVAIGSIQMPVTGRTENLKCGIRKRFSLLQKIYDDASI